MLARRVFAPYCGPLCRAGLSTSETSWARRVPKQTGPKQTKQPGGPLGDSVAVTNSDSNSIGPTAEQWKEALDQTSGQKYYWNQRTNETTAVGEPKPGPLGRVQNRVMPVQAAGAGSSLLGMVAAGAGIGLVFSVIGRIF
ncbi:hypothetical protein WJX77_009710 [Trebouxia sp. C0004]